MASCSSCLQVCTQQLSLILDATVYCTEEEGSAFFEGCGASNSANTDAAADPSRTPTSHTSDRIIIRDIVPVDLLTTSCTADPAMGCEDCGCGYDAETQISSWCECPNGICGCYSCPAFFRSIEGKCYAECPAENEALSLTSEPPALASYRGPANRDLATPLQTAPVQISPTIFECPAPGYSDMTNYMACNCPHGSHTTDDGTTVKCMECPDGGYPDGQPPMCSSCPGSESEPQVHISGQCYLQMENTVVAQGKRAVCDEEDAVESAAPDASEAVITECPGDSSSHESCGCSIVGRAIYVGGSYKCAECTDPAARLWGEPESCYRCPDGENMAEIGSSLKCYAACTDGKVFGEPWVPMIRSCDAGRLSPDFEDCYECPPQAAELRWLHHAETYFCYRPQQYSCISCPEGQSVQCGHDDGVPVCNCYVVPTDSWLVASNVPHCFDGASWAPSTPTASTPVFVAMTEQHCPDGWMHSFQSQCYSWENSCPEGQVMWEFGGVLACYEKCQQGWMTGRSSFELATCDQYPGTSLTHIVSYCVTVRRHLAHCRQSCDICLS